jgi:hypothetical protein
MIEIMKYTACWQFVATIIAVIVIGMLYSKLWEAKLNAHIREYDMETLRQELETTNTTPTYDYKGEQQNEI